MSLPTYYQLKTFQDILNATLETLRVPITDQATVNRIKRNINMVYTNQVASSSRSWSWLNRTLVVTTTPYYESGTITVQQNVPYITFSSPVPGSKKNWFISIEGANQVHQIFEHEDQGLTATLTTPFSGVSNTAAQFRIWSDYIPLPADCQLVRHVVGAYRPEPLEPVSLQQLRKYQTANYSGIGKPEYYSEGPRIKPNPYSAIIGLSNPVSRQSDGYLKTLYFNQDPSPFIQLGDALRVTSTQNYEYDGDVRISAVNATNYSIQYTAPIPRTEANTAVGMPNEIQIYAIAEGQQDPYPTLAIHPSMDDYNQINTLIVDYQATPEPLLNATDEPEIPLQHRQVLFFGAMWLSSDRDTDMDRANLYRGLMEQEIQRMISLTTMPMKTPKIEFSKSYIRSKMQMPRRRFIVE